ncbi:hypothetical protein BKA64DRAFT_707877 [Cadophora sp. MPI-SDFR-AT-0126]|nr:hypothetical protein BKA64DRAFT_707877 [Leotiomycetes sp. MPI-SDFR-AT-0126]
MAATNTRTSPRNVNPPISPEQSKTSPNPATLVPQSGTQINSEAGSKERFGPVGALDDEAAPANEADVHLDMLPNRGPIVRNNSNISISSSFASLSSSIFSGGSDSSKSSIGGPLGASERLAALILEDVDLKRLCMEGISRNSIHRFERNLRRLLKLFSADLQKDASSPLERKAARFVAYLARNSAHLVCNEIDPNGEKPDMKTKGEVSDDSDAEGLDEEVTDLMEFRAFIIRSRAFKNLKINLELFVNPATNSISANVNKTTQELRMNIREEIPTPAMENASDYSSARCRFSLISSWIFRIADVIPRRPVPMGMKRVTWTCSCGISLYDDYEELLPGAAKDFERSLQIKAPQVKSTPREHVGPENSRINFRQRFTLVPATIRNVVNTLYGKFPVSGATDLPSVELRSEPSEQSHPGEQRSAEALFLLVCMNDGVGASIVRLRQLSVHDVDSDQKLFHVLRHMYFSLRQRWWSFLSLWSLKQINFVHFDLYEKSLIDVRELHVVPPEDEHTSYIHERTNLKPPIGTNLLMHYISCPQDATLRSPCLDKIPKKIGGKLLVCPVKGVSPGWGLQFVEGWNWKKILLVSFFTFVISATIVAVLCWYSGRSIQDAFAISSFMLACFALSVGALQAWLNMA